MKVGYVYDPIYLKHDTGNHPENAKRLTAIITHLKETRLIEKLTLIKPRPATTAELMLVHNTDLIALVQAVAKKGGGWLDPDTVVSPDSYDAALYAAGGVISAVDAVMKGEVDSALALVRPPGHHATPSRAMGFCLFNNIAIATKYALKTYKLERITIIDFDVHHGNGTQEAFYSDPQVLYISTHQYPYYPGSGSAEETGISAGKGANLNIPLPAGCGDTEYLEVFEQIIVPAVKRFKPELIMVSAGYDTHQMDQLAMMNMTTVGFARVTRVIKSLTDELCEGRMVFSLEGGYNLNALAESVKATFEALLGDDRIENNMGEPQRYTALDISMLIKKIKEVHALS